MEDRMFQTAFFNSTFTLTEPPASVDGKTFFTYCGILTALILVGFVVYKSRNSPQSKQQKKIKPEKSSKHVKGEKVSLDNEWLADTPTYQFAKANSKNKSSKKN